MTPASVMHPPGRELLPANAPHPVSPPGHRSGEGADSVIVYLEQARSARMLPVSNARAPRALEQQRT